MSNDHISNVEIELTKAVGLDSPELRTEKSMEQFKETLLKAIDKLSMDDFYLLSEEAQEWNNAAVKAHITGAPLPDFEEEQHSEQEEKTVDANKESLEETVKIARSIANPNMVETTPRRNNTFKDKAILDLNPQRGAGYRAKEFYLLFGLSSKPGEIVEALQKENLTISPSTLQTIQYEFRQAIVVLNCMGLLNKSEFEKIHGSGNLEVMKHGD